MAEKKKVEAKAVRAGDLVTWKSGNDTMLGIVTEVAATVNFRRGGERVEEVGVFPMAVKTADNGYWTPYTVDLDQDRRLELHEVTRVEL